MHIGITGSKGFIGTNLSNYLRDKGYRILEDSPNTLSSDFQAARFVDGCDVVIHLAGKTSHKDPSAVINSNVLPTHWLMNACHRFNARFIFAGTDHNRQDAFGASKQICHEMIERLSPWYVEALCVALPKVFGPRSQPFSHSFPSTILYSIANNLPYEHMISDPHVPLALIHVDSVCAIIENLLSHPYSDLSEMGYNDLPIVNVWHLGEFCLSIKQLCRIARGERFMHLPEKYHDQIISTVNWYKKHSNRVQHTPQAMHAAEALPETI